MYVCMYVRMYVYMYVCMHVCMYVCICVCVYVCVYIYIYCDDPEPSTTEGRDRQNYENFWEETDRVSPVKGTKSRLQALQIKPVETKHRGNIYNSTATRRSTQLDGSQCLEYTTNHKRR